MTELPYRRSSRALLVAGDRVLLAEHRTHTGPSVWVAPGGGVEGDETLHEALAREVFEEKVLHVGCKATGGDQLHLAEKTVKNYVSSLLAKLGMERRTQAAVYGAQHPLER